MTGRPAATPRTASASACGTMPALRRAASRRLAAQGLGSAPPTESANAVIALSTSDCCAWPRRLGRLAGRRGPAAQRGHRADRGVAAAQPASRSAAPPAPRGRWPWPAPPPPRPPRARTPRSAAGRAPRGRWRSGRRSSRSTPSGVASSHGGLLGAGGGGLGLLVAEFPRRAGRRLPLPVIVVASGAAASASDAPDAPAPTPSGSVASGAICGPAYASKPPITASMSAAIRSVTARLRCTVSMSSARSSASPSPVRAETGSTGVSARPSASSRRRRSCSQSLICSGGSVSIWLSTTVNTDAWPASGIRYRLCTAASAYFCGSRTQITMSASLDSRSTAAIDAVTTESWSGRSSRTRPSRSDSPESSTLARAYRWRRCTFSQSSSGATPCIPHTHACTCLVVGLVTPGGEKVAPDRALNSVDLPLPVPPASATTVWLLDSRSRSPARLSTASASSSSAWPKPPSAPSSGPWAAAGPRPAPGGPGRSGPARRARRGAGTGSARPAAARHRNVEENDVHRAASSEYSAW